jgi:hypothetical protein
VWKIFEFFLRLERVVHVAIAVLQRVHIYGPPVDTSTGKLYFAVTYSRFDTPLLQQIIAAFPPEMARLTAI